MKLAPREIDKLMLHNAGVLAQKRLARGLRLNHAEAIALIATQVYGFLLLFIIRDSILWHRYGRFLFVCLLCMASDWCVMPSLCSPCLV